MQFTTTYPTNWGGRGDIEPGEAGYIRSTGDLDLAGPSSEHHVFLGSLLPLAVWASLGVVLLPRGTLTELLSQLPRRAEEVLSMETALACFPGGKILDLGRKARQRFCKSLHAGRAKPQPLRCSFR